eukprot:755363-Pleurochrysis_carterae.AAC.4
MKLDFPVLKQKRDAYVSRLNGQIASLGLILITFDARCMFPHSSPPRQSFVTASLRPHNERKGRV